MSNQLTKAQLIAALEPFDDDLPVRIVNQSGLPFTYAVIGALADGAFDVAHLFDKSQDPPVDSAIYLTVAIIPAGD